MAVPMSLGGAFIGWFIPWTECEGTGLADASGYFDSDSGFVSNTLPSGWVPMVSTGSGGGGTGTILEQFVMFLPSSEVLNDTRFPDYSAPGLPANDRIVPMDVAAPFTLASWRRMSLALMNVQSNTNGAVSVALKNVTAGTTVATLTIANGSAPDSHHKVRTSAAIASGTFGDGDDIQYHVTSAPAGNAYGLLAVATYELS